MNTSILKILIGAIDGLNERIGRITAWAAIIMVLVQFTVVVLRYVFGIGFIWMQESVVYLHALLFLLGAAFTLLHEGHVRVDIFYRTASPLTQAKVDLVGAVIFLIPVSVLIIWSSTGYIATSWSVFEGSKETSGIQAVYLLKSMILAFSGLMALQGVSMAMRSVLEILGHPLPHPHKDVTEL